MKKATLFLLLTAASLLAAAQNTITLHPADAKETISKNIYGHFAEHLGHCIYGGFFVGKDNKTIPNTNGLRNDIIEALKKLKTPQLRWPGGCFADSYHWKDAVGPQAQRKPIYNMWWGGVKEDNSFGTHEFLQLCELINAEPYLAANVGSGTVEEAADWVKYINHPNGTSAMTDWRQKNGRSKPWLVKYWGVGNETWGCGGNLNVNEYIPLYKRYATFMSSPNIPGDIYRIACGPGSPDFNWTEELMKGIPHWMMNGISIHHYSVIDWNKKGSATDFSEQQYFQTMEQAWKMEYMIEGNKAVMDKYDPNKKIALVVDEWGGWYDTEPGTNGAFLYQQSTMRDAMIAGLTLNIFNNNCDRVKLANLAQTVNVLQAIILTKDAKMILTPTYHVMEMYNVHQDATLLPLNISSNDYVMGDKKLKAVSASASKDKNGKTHISLVNIHATAAQTISIDLGELKAAKVSGRILSGSKLQDYNSFDKPNTLAS